MAAAAAAASCIAASPPISQISVAGTDHRLIHVANPRSFSFSHRRRSSVMASNNPQTLPRPLSDSSAFPSDSGSRLRVAYQGLPGAYSEVAALKAYPNFEAVPCDETPFYTSIVFSLQEGPGVLFKALAVFTSREINLTKIESRPWQKKPLRVTDDGRFGNTGPLKYFEYLFYVDFEASTAERNAQNALGHLKEFVTFLRVLGSYPMDTCES